MVCSPPPRSWRSCRCSCSISSPRTHLYPGCPRGRSRADVERIVHPDLRTVQRPGARVWAASASAHTRDRSARGDLIAATSTKPSANLRFTLTGTKASRWPGTRGSPSRSARGRPGAGRRATSRLGVVLLVDHPQDLPRAGPDDRGHPWFEPPPATGQCSAVTR